jgi:hypothetical protein
MSGGRPRIEIDWAEFDRLCEVQPRVRHFLLACWRIQSENTRLPMKTCTVACEDANGHQHTLEVTAESLYEAVAQALAAFRNNAWVGR